MCDTIRHDSMRHETTEDQDTTVFMFGAAHNACTNKDYGKKGWKPLDTTICIVFELSTQKSNPKVLVEFYR